MITEAQNRQNFFLTTYYDWRPNTATLLDRVVNRLLRAVGLRRRMGPHSGFMSNIEKRINLYHLLDQVIAFEVDGDVVELGCFTGQTASLFATVLRDLGSDRSLHLYDSFEGLPNTSKMDGTTPFKPGWLKTSEDVVRANFKRLGLRDPHIHKGWFHETLPDQLPAKIAFAHLDGDFFDSIYVSLRHVYPRLSKGAICVIDDYNDPSCGLEARWDKLPGVKAACDKFLNDKPEQIIQLYAGDFAHAYFRKL